MGGIMDNPNLDNYKRYLKFYVVAIDMNTDKPYMFNIFNNYYVFTNTIKYIEELKNNKLSLDEFKQEFKVLLRWEEHGRFEYEIAVCSLLNIKEELATKMDCYEQFLPNLDMFVNYVDMLVKSGKI